MLAFFLVPGLAAAGLPLSGSYRADSYGTLALKTEGEHVSGRVVEGGPCHFDAQREVLVGDFEGSVLVARLTVCQTGSMCPAEQTYPVLGFYNEEDSTLVAHVRLREGCQSLGLQKSGRFILVPLNAAGSPAETPAGGSGAVQDPPGKRGARNVEAAKQASQRGDQFYKAHKWDEAAAQFKQSLDYDSGDSNWPAYLGRGSSLLKMSQVNLAIKDLEKAHSANPQNGFILYMLGCAYAQKRDKPKALDYLKRAVSAGYELHAVAEHDQDLTHALGNDPQFKDLVKSSREKNSRGTAGSGTSSP
ncbi:MAG: tetratricopeptide repeat protein [Hyalangium sp.]|uniref:tetratricopeptide repeat protein n=1 Tax=Hyalangium sp. TaxID=2028555 RepID=UPI003899E193